MTSVTFVFIKINGLAEVYLCFTRNIDKRHIKQAFLAVELLFLLGYIQCYQTVRAVKTRTILLVKPLKDPQSCVALLLALLLVCFQPAVNLDFIPVQLGSTLPHRFWERFIEVFHVNVFLHRLYVMSCNSCNVSIIHTFSKNISLIELTCAIVSIHPGSSLVVGFYKG